MFGSALLQPACSVCVSEHFFHDHCFFPEYYTNNHNWNSSRLLSLCVFLHLYILCGVVV